MKTLFCIITLLLISTSLNGQTNDSSSFVNILFYDAPVHCYAEQSNVIGQGIGITEVNIGFNREMNEPEVLKRRFKFQYLNIGVGYKNFNDNSKQSFPFLSGYLLKISTYEGYGPIAFCANLSLLEKKTNFYTNSDMDWFNIGGEFGYNFFADNKEVRLAPVVCMHFGLNTSKPDTLVFRGLPVQSKEASYGWLQGGFKLYASYKAFDLTAEYGGKFSGFYRMYGAAELSYTLWKENPKMSNTVIKNYQNDLRAFLNFNTQGMYVNNPDDNAYPEVLYTHSIQVLKIGLSGMIGRIGKIM